MGNIGVTLKRRYPQEGQISKVMDPRRLDLSFDCVASDTDPTEPKKVSSIESNPFLEEQKFRETLSYVSPVVTSSKSHMSEHTKLLIPTFGVRQSLSRRPSQ